jgi:alkylation response protein AidB-like acyl-CoA dehydrogenase
MDFDLTDEQRMFKEQVMKFAKKEIVPRVQEHDLECKFDFESWRKLGEFGILGMHLPEDVGGSNADVMTVVVASEGLGQAGVDGGLMLAYGAHSFLFGSTVDKNGTPEQRKKYLPKIATGEMIGCMGLTEPNAGSDVAGMETRAVKKGDKYILNGSKIFITNGAISDAAVVYAKTDPDAGHAGMSAFIVETGTPGYSFGQKFNKMGMHSSVTSELIFEDCEIPAENLLGSEGGGFFMALQTVEWDRSVLCSPMIGQAQYMLERCLRYSQEREQFGRPIAKFQAVQQKIANIKIFLEAARPLIYRIAWCKDQGRPVSHLEAAVAKLFIGDWSLGPANDAMCLFGGYGYCHEYDMERIFRDSRLAAIGGGTSEIQKLIISRMM